MSDYPSATGARGGLKLKHIALLLFVAFAGGGIATWWLADEYGLLGASGPAAVSGLDSGNAPRAAGNVAPAPAALGTTGDNMDQVPPVLLTGTVPSADSARGEGLLLTYVVRRTLDEGAPLGYLSEQLRLRFGASQPQAVATVISAAQAPVTRDMLRTELAALEPALIMNNKDEDLWTTIKREFSELFVLRMDGTVTVAPNQRFVRAEALVEAGDIKASMADIALLPGADSARAWLARAKRYDDARTALKQLEEMALVRPLAAPVAVIPPPTVEQPEAEPLSPTP